MADLTWPEPCAGSLCGGGGGGGAGLCLKGGGVPPPNTPPSTLPEGTSATPIPPPPAFPTARDCPPTDFTARPNRFVTALSLPPERPPLQANPLGGGIESNQCCWHPAPILDWPVCHHNAPAPPTAIRCSRAALIPQTGAPNRRVRDVETAPSTLDRKWSNPWGTTAPKRRILYPSSVSPISQPKS